MRRFLPFVSVLGLLAAGDSARADPVDRYVRAAMRRQHIPGVSLAVIRDGKVIKAKGYGWANVELKVRATPDTVYQIQSITKSFTATGVMMLVEAGQVRLEDPISRYLPDLPDAWKPVTVKHLLNHTSGIKDFINEPTVNLKLDVTPEEVIRSLASLPLNFAPGAQWAYSNTNYHLLGMILRRVTGKGWDEFLRERIFEPIGMKDTRVVSLTECIPHRASGYFWENGAFRNGDYVAPTILGYAGGGLRSTVLDMARWDAALATEKLLRQSTLARMWAKTPLADGKTADYGFGWGVGEIAGHPTVGHGGAHMTGFTSNISRFPQDKLTVIVLTNTRMADPQSIARRVAGCYIPALAPPAYRPIKDREPQVTALMKSVIAKTLEGTLTPDMFTPAIWAEIFPDRNKQAGAFLKTLGPLRSVALVERKDETEKRIYRYRLSFEAAPFLVVLALTPDNLITDLMITPEF